MTIQPNDNWYWYFNKEYNRLVLDLSDQMLFCSRLTLEKLNSDCAAPIKFDLDDTDRFFRFDECCYPLCLPASQHLELVLNAVAAIRFLKPTLAKSWYFTAYPSDTLPLVDSLMAVNLIEDNSTALVLIIAVNSKASLCLIAQPTLMLANKQYYLGEAITIMNDRLLPIIFDHDQHSYALAI